MLQVWQRFIRILAFPLYAHIINYKQRITVQACKILIPLYAPFSGTELIPIQFYGTLPIPDKYAQSWTVSYYCCSPLAVSLTGNPCRRCVVQYWRSNYFKMVLAVYISLDSHSVVLSLSNKTPRFPVYPPCRKFTKKQLFSIMLEISGRNPPVCVVFCFRKGEICL